MSSQIKRSQVEEWKIERVILYANNAKMHPEQQVEAIAKSIDEFTFLDPIAVDEKGEILEGHGRVLAAQRRGDKTIPVIQVTGLSEEQKRAYRLAHNKLTMNSGFDMEMLKIEFDFLEEAEFDLSLTGFDDLELNFDELDDPLEEDEGAIAGLVDKAKTGIINSRVSLGEVWRLGRHFLACGDCTLEANLGALLNHVKGRDIDMIFTDPPYGVNYGEKNKDLNAIAAGKRIETPIENDGLTPDECYQNLWLPAFKNLYAHTKKGGVYYVCSPFREGLLMRMQQALSVAGWLLKSEVVWVKNNHVLGRMDYHAKHEPILYGWKPGSGHYFTESRSEMSVWNFDKPVKSDLHPTMKPVPLVEYAIANSSQHGDIIADCFLGSGTTLIATEQAKGDRTCVGFELSPQYCEVICQRYETLTKEKAVKVGYLS